METDLVDGLMKTASSSYDGNDNYSNTSISIIESSWPSISFGFSNLISAI